MKRHLNRDFPFEAHICGRLRRRPALIVILPRPGAGVQRFPAKIVRRARCFRRMANFWASCDKAAHTPTAIPVRFLGISANIFVTLGLHTRWLVATLLSG